jgi:hypothetical protein
VIRRLVVAVLSAALMWTLALSSGVANASVSTRSAATPQLGNSGTDGSVETVRQIVQCGGTMYAVGLFSRVKNPNSATLITRNNAFAFPAEGTRNVSAWNPNVNGRVDTVACGTDSTYVLLGGSFTSVNGTAVRNVAKVNTTTGAVLPYAFQPTGRVAHIEVVTDAGGVRHALFGGYFTGLLDSRNPVTGADDGYGTPTITGNYNDFPGVVVPARRIWNMTVSPNGRAVLMAGVFDTVGGQHHEQIFRLNLTAGSSTVSRWSPTELYQHCIGRQAFYAQDAAWSTDMSQVFVVSTGYRLDSEFALPATQRPQVRTGPCDAAIAYQATNQAEFSGHTWINYTGCDSLYAVAADASTVFIAGHQRWISNGQRCDALGPAPARAQSGLGELTPTSGADQPGPNRGRGLGANDLLRTSAGLWIGSDNQANTAGCGTVQGGRMGICFLPN